MGCYVEKKDIFRIFCCLGFVWCAYCTAYNFIRFHVSLVY